MEGLEFLKNDFTRPVPLVGVVVVDGAYGSKDKKQWTWGTFVKLVKGLWNIACEPAQFMLVAFVNLDHLWSLRNALDKVARKYVLETGAIDFKDCNNNEMHITGSVDSFVARVGKQRQRVHQCKPICRSAQAPYLG